MQAGKKPKEKKDTHFYFEIHIFENFTISQYNVNTSWATQQSTKRIFDNDVINAKTIQRQFQRFHTGNNVKNERIERPKSALQCDKLKNLVEQIPKNTIRGIS